MVRARLGFLALAGTLLVACGCATHRDNECESGGWFSRFRLTSRTNGAHPCECEGTTQMAASDGTMIVPPNAMVPPGAFAAPPPTIITNPQAAPQPPRIVPVPQQANPMPYTPMVQ